MSSHHAERLFASTTATERVLVALRPPTPDRYATKAALTTLVVIAPRFHAVSTRPHLTPAPAAVAALVDEQSGTIGRGALANSPHSYLGFRRYFGSDRWGLRNPKTKLV